MERLSDTAIEIINELHTERLDYSSEYIPLIDAANRLAAYEDTGLEPEEIYEVRFLIAAQRDPQKLARLRELVLADQNGKLVVLPCKAGDHVWVDGREAVVENFFGYETERYLHAQFYDNMQYIDIPFTEIGKTVFLTREEAALAQEGGTNEDSGSL